MNRTQKPNKSLHYYNALMEFAENDIQEICDNENLNIVQIKVEFWENIFILLS